MKSQKLLILIITGLLLLMSYTTPAAKYSGIAEGAGMEEINFTLPDISGEMVKLADFHGKKVYIKFWATWCSICLAGLEEFAEFNEENSAADDLVVLTIVSPGYKGEMSSEDFKTWFAGRGYNFTVLLDEGGRIASQYGVRAYPASVLIDTQGKIARALPGHLSNAQLHSLIGALH